MATKRRSAPRRTPGRRRTPGPPSLPIPSVGPDVVRSIIGIILLILGSVTLIALILPGQGTLTDWWAGTVGPWFGTMRWLLPFLLLLTGWYIEWGPGRLANSGWGATFFGIAGAYVSLLGAVEVAAWASGGRIGRILATIFHNRVPGPAAFVILVGLGVLALVYGLNVPLRTLLSPVTGTARWFGTTAAASMRRDPAAGDPPPGA
ncbi:MAG TPA: hypothetical protein VIM39_08180, partial [Candidatus Limnocylindrales bacterium]